MHSNAFWRSYVANPSGAGAAQAVLNADTLKELYTMYAKTCRGPDKIGVILVDDNAWVIFVQAAENKLRFMNSKQAADFGFTGYDFFGATLVLDGGVGGDADMNTFLALNIPSFSWYTHPDFDMTPFVPGGQMPIDQEVSVHNYGLMCALTQNAAQYSGRMIGTPA